MLEVSRAGLHVDLEVNEKSRNVHRQVVVLVEPTFDLEDLITDDGHKNQDQQEHADQTYQHVIRRRRLVAVSERLGHQVIAGQLKEELLNREKQSTMRVG